MLFAGTDGRPNVQPTPIGGYAPKDIDGAYKLPSTTKGDGQTVAIVDAFGYPSAELDMGIYRAYYGLPPCTRANKCFKKLNQEGVEGQYPPYDAGWSLEQSADLEMVSAACPKCHIILVEANTNAVSDIGISENTAAATGTSIISDSFGGPDQGYLDEQYGADFNHKGIVITVAAGDGGYGVDFPADRNTVVSVGGTTLTKASNSRGWAETVWAGTGSGCSTQTKPSWQKDSGCPFRTLNDVAADADLNTGVNLFCKCYGGWFVGGGTSIATPIVASIYALAGNARSQHAAESLYSDPKNNLYDVTKGSNGKCVPTYLCQAKIGYDGPSGNGTPNGVSAF